jgi:hypothetical protein
MKYNIFCVRDRATDSYGSPMFLVSAGQAIRSFSDEVNRSDPQNMIFNHPDDFDLYCFGSWDASTGLFELEPPRQVAIGKDLRISK